MMNSGYDQDCYIAKKVQMCLGDGFNNGKGIVIDNYYPPRKR